MALACALLLLLLLLLPPLLLLHHVSARSVHGRVDGGRPWRGNDRTYQIVTQQ